jgi:hypothetical protein
MKFFITVFLLCLNISIFSQLDVVPTIIDFQILADDNKFTYNFEIKNLDSLTAKFYWMLELGEGWEDEWEVNFYDSNFCYPPGVLKCSDTKPNVLRAGDSTIFKFDFTTRRVEGETNMNLKFFSMPDCVDEIFSTNFEGRVQVGGIPDVVNTTKIDVKPEAYPHPNPTQDFLTIFNDEQIASINLFDYSGKSHYQSTHSRGQIHDLQIVSAGIYILEMYMDKGDKIIDRVVKY